MTQMYLIDTSGSMVRFENQVEEFISGTERDSVVFGLNFDGEIPVRVLSDVGEEGFDELDFIGPTPLHEAVSILTDMGDGPITIVTDGVPNRPEEFERAYEEAENEIEIKNLEEESE